MAERRNWTAWTDQEIADLIAIRARPEGLKHHLHLFHGRSLASVLHKSRQMHLPRKSTGEANRGGPNEAIVLQLLELRPMDITELAVKIGISERAARFRVNDLHAAGRIHITRWERFSQHGAAARMWAPGPGIDAPRPQPIPHKIREGDRIKRMRKNDPLKYARFLARKRLMEGIRTGRLVKRDQAAQALFGPASNATNSHSEAA